MRRISVDDAAQDLPLRGALQTFGTFRTGIVDPFAAPVADAMRVIVQTITIARVQRLLLTVDVG